MDQMDDMQDRHRMPSSYHTENGARGELRPTGVRPFAAKAFNFTRKVICPSFRVWTVMSVVPSVALLASTITCGKSVAATRSGQYRASAL
ncbi:uncharacterized protein SPSK_04731 [Sporothrix schenckii 1099-18]|uniref:Uncharacterized protein n=1 Tax=Sporothrix schenckii 1099-18 TaxID=1397361 RepID=A0A0F2M425_SPOSC|nr:uncharacterized protein SPSK_04731 [Sporothrix schenckii 1099-18]KJR83844.1 hypothetical protein SPSK_04731 [Sporothrix schenckii 1099-18]